MKKLITISREYGSGGLKAGKILAEKLGIPFYDREEIFKKIEEQGYSREMIETAETKAKNGFSYGLGSALFRTDYTAAGNLSVNEKIFLANYNVVKEICASGEGVIVGRCADYILDDVPGVTNVFVYAELEDRIKKVKEDYGIEYDNMEKYVKDYDKGRANYYHYHTGRKWGDFHYYNLMINSSYISADEIANLIQSYIENRDYDEE
ncbi:MAG: cytidylate kinase-like family protein [Clostridia bacterium]|nr:cytidylate kinase-like family protein [Clostridia bacterium]